MFLDIIFLIFLGVSFYWGYQKGIIYAVFSLLAYLIGIVVALKCSAFAVRLIQGALKTDQRITTIIAFILVFILVVLLVRLIAWGLEHILKSFSLNTPNRLIGGSIYGVIGIYAFSLMFWFIYQWGAMPLQTRKESHVWKHVETLAPDAMRGMGKVVPAVQHAFEEMEELVDKNMGRYGKKRPEANDSTDR